MRLQLPAQRRPHAVGADQREAALFHDPLIAARMNGNAVDVSGKILDARGKPERDVLRVFRGIDERRLQVAAMDRPIGRAVAAFSRVAERNAHDLAAGAAGHHADRLRQHRRGRKTLTQAERDQHAGRIGSELNSGAGLFQLGGLLKHGDAQTGARSANAVVSPAMPAPATMT